MAKPNYHIHVLHIKCNAYHMCVHFSVTNHSLPTLAHIMIQNTVSFEFHKNYRKKS